MTRSIGVLMALALAIALAVAFDGSVAAEPGVATPPDDFAPGQIVVKISSGPLGILAESALESLGLKTISRMDQIGYRLVQVPAGQEKKLAQVVRGLPLVSYAGTNGIVHTLETPNDPFLGQQWAPGTMNLYQAWDVMTGTSTVKIAIVDTGVSPTHPDLVGKIVTGTRILSGTEYPGEYADDHGHGTHVAGIAAASSNNGIGIVGVDWGAEVLPVKVLKADGSGSDFDAAMGIIRAADMGAQVINCSFGGTAGQTDAAGREALCAAADYAKSRGSLVVVAAGNSRNDVYWPAVCPSALAVGSTGPSDAISGFSSVGSHIWVVAPGETIFSTYRSNGSDTYTTLQGTSMATPQVSGVASLVLSTKPWLSPYWLKYILKVSAVDLGTPGFDNEYGWGRVDAQSALSHTAEITRVVLPLVNRLQ